MLLFDTNLTGVKYLTGNDVVLHSLQTESSPFNTTVDIVKAGCFVDPYDTVACSRYAVMSFIIILTGCLCVYRIVRLHLVRHEGYHHYFIFYSCAISCTLCAIHWLLGTFAQLDFLAQWFMQLSYLFVTHFCWTRAHRALRTMRMTNLCLLPCLIIGFIYCSSIVVIGSLQVSDYKNACLAIHWVLMSSAEFFIANMFLVAGILISKRLDRISTVQSVRTSQKCKLWSLVITLELSATFGLCYDLSMKALGNDVDGCGKIFNYNQILYSCVFGSFMIIKFALPVWALLAALEPIEASPVAEDEDSSSYQSSDSVPILGRQWSIYRSALLNDHHDSGAHSAASSNALPAVHNSETTNESVTPNGIT